MMRNRAIVMAAAAAIVLSGEALGQRGPRNNPPPTPAPAQPQPAQPAQAPPAVTPGQPATTTPQQPKVEAPVPLDVPSPYIQLTRERGWTLKAHLMVRAPKEYDKDGMPIDQSFAFESAVVVFPILGRTGSSKLDGPDGQWPITWKLRIDGRDPGGTFEYVQNHPGGTDLGKWTIQNQRCEYFELELQYPMLCYETRYDEQKAASVPWPKGPWPAECQATLQRQMFLDYGPDESGQMRQYDLSRLDALVKQWTEGKDPKSIPPATLAKWLAGQVQEFFQISGNGLSWSRLGELEGMDVQGVEVSARTGRGSQFDLVALLTAAYRRAGLPARMMIGFDVGEAEDDRFLEKKSRSDNDLRAWVEFALWDEASRTLTWVPVDIVRMRKSSSRMQNFNQTWRWFGTNDELDQVIPMSHHFHPPTTVRAYNAPAMWGWLMFPDAPYRAEQALGLSAMTTPKRSGRPGRSGY